MDFLPTTKELADKLSDGITLNDLELFVLEYTPIDSNQEREFREALCKAISYFCLDVEDRLDFLSEEITKVLGEKHKRISVDVKND